MPDIATPTMPMPANPQRFSTVDIMHALSPGVNNKLLVLDIQAANIHNSLPKVSDLNTENALLEDGLQKLGQLADKRPLYNEFSTLHQDIQKNVADLTGTHSEKLAALYAEIKALQQTMRSQKVSPSADSIAVLRNKTGEYRKAAEAYEVKFNEIRLKQLELRGKLSRNTTLEAPVTPQTPTLR